ncbi:ATP synthase subunit delta, mitochondrial isoform X1 [Oryctolagus cuniculus]|uniref:ATP synthase subunit delta, mitochondrial isoform X1 n=1 Tax=Oryctolagus cuniculus TaxID=9986 RepID=UPI0038799695
MHPAPAPAVRPAQSRPRRRCREALRMRANGPQGPEAGPGARRPRPRPRGRSGARDPTLPTDSCTRRTTRLHHWPAPERADVGKLPSRGPHPVQDRLAAPHLALGLPRRRGRRKLQPPARSAAHDVNTARHPSGVVVRACAVSGTPAPRRPCASSSSPSRPPASAATAERPLPAFVRRPPPAFVRRRRRHAARRTAPPPGSGPPGAPGTRLRRGRRCRGPRSRPRPDVLYLRLPDAGVLQRRQREAGGRAHADRRLRHPRGARAHRAGAAARAGGGPRRGRHHLQVLREQRLHHGERRLLRAAAGRGGRDAGHAGRGGCPREPGEGAVGAGGGRGRGGQGRGPDPHRGQRSPGEGAGVGGARRAAVAPCVSNLVGGRKLPQTSDGPGSVLWWGVSSQPLPQADRWHSPPSIKHRRPASCERVPWLPPALCGPHASVLSLCCGVGAPGGAVMGWGRGRQADGLTPAPSARAQPQAGGVASRRGPARSHGSPAPSPRGRLPGPHWCRPRRERRPATPRLRPGPTGVPPRDWPRGGAWLGVRSAEVRLCHSPVQVTPQGRPRFPCPDPPLPVPHPGLAAINKTKDTALGPGRGPGPASPHCLGSTRGHAPGWCGSVLARLPWGRRQDPAGRFHLGGGGQVGNNQDSLGVRSWALEPWPPRPPARSSPSLCLPGSPGVIWLPTPAVASPPQCGQQGSPSTPSAPPPPCLTCWE